MEIRELIHAGPYAAVSAGEERIEEPESGKVVQKALVLKRQEQGCFICI